MKSVVYWIDYSFRGWECNRYGHISVRWFVTDKVTYQLDVWFKVGIYMFVCATDVCWES